MAGGETDKFDRLDRLAEEFARRYRRGERPALEEYVDRHPELAHEIRELFPALVEIERGETGRREPTSPPIIPDRPHRFGDFRILRELGRGGMGVVYEAIQESLDRHVALKVLPPVGRSEPSRLERFRLEARAAARLHHTNIVPVFGVGEHEGVPYYAMQFIAGTGLDAILAALRRQRSGGSEEGHAADSDRTQTAEASARSAARGAATGLATDRLGPGNGWRTEPSATTGGLLTGRHGPAAGPGSDAATPAGSGLSGTGDIDETLCSGPSDGPYWRAVARIGLQVAEALAYAHAQGILHRDIKPSNLLMDARGTVWVADFGLAKLEGSDGPTRVGDIVGTLRYMAPERFEGRADPRSDLYALGATLYELMTLRPAFDGTGRAQLIERVLHAEPVPPRRLDRHIPLDLETVVHKALAKGPEGRYDSAERMAEDLRRFLAGEPIRARPVGTWERGLKWARRRPTAAALWAVSLLSASALVAGVSWHRERLLDERAAASVNALESAPIEDVPRILGEFKGELRRANPRLAERAARLPAASRERLNLALALRPVDPAQVDYLFGRLRRASPEELPVILGALHDDRRMLVPRLWAELDDPADPARRFRAACALARFDPECPRWRDFGRAVVDWLVDQNTLDVAQWAKALRPVRRVLLEPLAAIARDGEHRSLAVSLLVEYAGDQVDLLTDLVPDADDRQFAMLVPRLLRDPDRPAGRLARVLDAPGPPGRQARAAAALIRLDRPSRAWPLLGIAADPIARADLIRRLAPLGVEPEALIRRFRDEPDVSIRRALVLALGEYPEGAWTTGMRQAAIGDLARAYRDDPDPGLHSACEWTLGRWGRGPDLSRIDRELAEAGVVPDRRWSVNGMGMTLAVIPGPVRFWVGSPPDEPGREPIELRYFVQIDRSFAIATKEVTVEQFRRFLAEHPEVGGYVNPKYSPEPGCPANSVTWYQAAQFCRWLSEVEGLPEDQMCYPPIPMIKPGMSLPPDHRERTGYRLPTEAEWEYGGAAGLRRFALGELLPGYGWHVANSDDRTRLVGLLRPNDLGLFDALGNVAEWCGHRLELPPNFPRVQLVEDRPTFGTVPDEASLAIRGGAFLNRATDLRTAARDGARPGSNLPSVGFRVARTLPIGDRSRMEPGRPAREDLALPGRDGSSLQDGPTARPRADGRIHLLATDAAISGRSARLELIETILSIGFWIDPDDHLTWSVDLPAAGAYRVVIEYACARGFAGSTYRIGPAGSTERVEGTVEDTGGWDAFRTEAISGAIRLAQGPQILDLIPISMPRLAVMNIRRIELIPAP